MSPYELFMVGGNQSWYDYNEEPGLIWLQKFTARYKKCIWLNPIKEAKWQWAYGARTIQAVGEVFPMYELTLDGLDKGIHKLLTR